MGKDDFFICDYCKEVEYYDGSMGVKLININDEWHICERCKLLSAFRKAKCDKIAIYPLCDKISKFSLIEQEKIIPIRKEPDFTYIVRSLDNCEPDIKIYGDWPSLLTAAAVGDKELAYGLYRKPVWSLRLAGGLRLRRPVDQLPPQLIYATTQHIKSGTFNEQETRMQLEEINDEIIKIAEVQQHIGGYGALKEPILYVGFFEDSQRRIVTIPSSFKPYEPDSVVKCIKDIESHKPAILSLSDEDMLAFCFPLENKEIKWYTSLEDLEVAKWAPDLTHNDWHEIREWRASNDLINECVAWMKREINNLESKIAAYEKALSLHD
jgi:hypothetical protein